MKIFKIAMSLLMAIILLVVISVIVIYYSTYNPNTGVLHLKGLTGMVTIFKDKNGVVHIDAKKSDGDAFFALGYMHAHDRFWQMEMQRHIVKGTLSEIFGKATIKKDEYLRTWGFYRASKNDWKYLSPTTKAIVENYTRGVNAFLKTGKLPLEFKVLRYKPKPWTNIDSIVWAKMMAWDLQSSWMQKIKNYFILTHYGKLQIPILQPPYPATAITILNPKELRQAGLYSADNKQLTSKLYANNSALDQTFAELLSRTHEIRKTFHFQNLPAKGSNNWVVSGKFTHSGKPILANDPHLGFNAPLLWYLVDVKGPHLHIVGASVPGLPGIILGHNDYIAWGFTNVNPDTQDLYIESKQAKLTKRIELIKVRGDKTIDFPVYESKNGPIISAVTKAKLVGPRVALKWNALMPGDTTIDAFMKLNYAENWPEFKAALKFFVEPSQNIVYADTRGNIGYYLPGRIPIRKGWSGALPVSDDGLYRWQGYIPFAKLPHIYNPKKGYIVSSNNKAVPTGYPYVITFRWKYLPYRAETITDLIENKKDFTIADMEKIQLNIHDRYWEEMKAILLKTKPLNKQCERALKLLKNWDGHATQNSQATTIFVFWLAQINADLVPKAYQKFLIKPIFLFVLSELQNNGVYCQNSQYKTCQTLLNRSLNQALEKLNQRLGYNPARWHWSKVHKLEFQGMGVGESNLIGWIWNRTIATPGDYITVNAGTYDAKTFMQNEGPGYRELIDLNNFDHSRYIIALGQSGNPLSKNYDNLMRKWRDGDYIKIDGVKRTGKVLKLLPKNERSVNGN